MDPGLRDRNISSMAKVLVTGASGFLGSHIVRKALERGYEVRALVRESSSLKNIDGLPVEIVHGDIRAKDRMLPAMKGCSLVFHAAADYRFTSLQGDDVVQTNVEGTKNVVEAAMEAGVERMVYTSSTATIGIPDDGSPGNEETPLSEADLVGPYKQSKYVAELVVKKAASQGFPVVIVNPSAPVGTHDSKPTPTGKFIVDFLNGKMFAYTDTGLNLVDAEDVADGHFLAAQKGKQGERYILGNRNLPFKEILDMLATITGLPSPKVRLPHGAVLFIARVNELVSKGLLKKEPGIPVEGVKLSRKKMFFDAGKARKELGMQQASVITALEKAVKWYNDNGYVR